MSVVCYIINPVSYSHQSRRDCWKGFFHSLIWMGPTAFGISITPIDTFYYDTKMIHYAGRNSEIAYKIYFDGYPVLDTWEIKFLIGNVPSGKGRSFYEYSKIYTD